MTAPSLDEVMVNDLFWFIRAREMIERAVTAREEAATRLVTGVGWFWTVYSSVAIVGVAIAEQDFSVPVGIALASPAILLMLTYLLALRVLLPFDGEFERKSPDSIEAAYRAALDQKRTRLKIAVLAAATSALSVGVAVLVAAITSQEVELSAAEMILR